DLAAPASPVRRIGGHHVTGVAMNGVRVVVSCVDDVAAGTSVDRIEPDALDGVRAVAAPDPVGPAATEQDLVAATAPYPVVAVAAVDDIVRAPPVDLVVSAPTLDHRGNGHPHPHGVVAISGRDAQAAHAGGGTDGPMRALHRASPRAVHVLEHRCRVGDQ